ncbi:DUF998 domain-containing protein [Gleimia coleocanis]|uniref:DUF998 domain-containing protein n=1 Tax=Gleimia coleocanis TaxID=103618 RepID=UPI0013012A7B|nr:DUF998 domain-containing protein [Gleimia coleocanis]
MFVLLGGFLYISWPLGWFWYPSFFKARTFYLSELASLSQPTSGVFRTVDFLSGLFVLLGAVLVFLSFPRASHQGTFLVKMLWVGVGLFGLATVFDSFFPMSCSPTAEATCNQEFLDFARPFTDTAHEFSSSFAQLGIITALVSACILFFARGYVLTNSTGYTFTQLPVFTRVYTVFTLGTSLLLAAAPFVSFLPINVFQPLGVTAWALWVAFCSRFFFPADKHVPVAEV